MRKDCWTRTARIRVAFFFLFLAFGTAGPRSARGQGRAPFERVVVRPVHITLEDSSRGELPAFSVDFDRERLPDESAITPAAAPPQSFSALQWEELVASVHAMKTNASRHLLELQRVGFGDGMLDVGSPEATIGKALDPATKNALEADSALFRSLREGLETPSERLFSPLRGNVASVCYATATWAGS
jgi:hypothetical protein